MEQMFQALIDRSRGPLDVKKIKTILGTKRCPRAQSEGKEAGSLGSGARETCV